MKITSSFSLPLRGTLPFLLLTLWFMQEPTAFAQGSPPEQTSAKLQIGKSYGALPLSFEKNGGQADPQVHFLSRGPGYSILFKDREAVLLLSKSNLVHEKPLRIGERIPGVPRNEDTSTDVLWMRLDGQSSGAVVSGEAQLPGTVNYFAGNESPKWLSGIPNSTACGWRTWTSMPGRSSRRTARRSPAAGSSL